MATPGYMFNSSTSTTRRVIPLPPFHVLCDPLQARIATFIQAAKSELIHPHAVATTTPPPVLLRKAKNAHRHLFF